MKTKAELQSVIDQIARADSPVGMDAVYVHALILDKLERIEQRLDMLEAQVGKQPLQPLAPARSETDS